MIYVENPEDKGEKPQLEHRKCSVQVLCISKRMKYKIFSSVVLFLSRYLKGRNMHIL